MHILCKFPKLQLKIDKSCEGWIFQKHLFLLMCNRNIHSFFSVAEEKYFSDAIWLRRWTSNYYNISLLHGEIVTILKLMFVFSSIMCIVKGCQALLPKPSWIFFSISHSATGIWAFLLSEWNCGRLLSISYNSGVVAHTF